MPPSDFAPKAFARLTPHSGTKKCRALDSIPKGLRRRPPETALLLPRYTNEDTEPTSCSRQYSCPLVELGFESRFDFAESTPGLKCSRVTSMGSSEIPCQSTLFGMLSMSWPTALIHMVFHLPSRSSLHLPPPGSLSLFPAVPLTRQSQER